MGKLVVLKLGDGSFEQGFPVTLQIGEDGDRPSAEVVGKLPPNPEIPQYYSYWQSAYYRLGLRTRLEAAAVQVTNVSVMEDCHNAARMLCQSLNAWLNSASFRSIKEKLLEKLMPSDVMRVIIQTENSLLQRLPWHQSDLFVRYPKSEIALSAPAFDEIVTKPLPYRAKIRILAILGSSVGIDTQADRVLLENLSDAEVCFLVEPPRRVLDSQLWNPQGWDILFFAGHSASGVNCEFGRIYINQTESLTISDLKNAVHTAVENGLKLAIFNSCDGLGLARELSGLQIPQIVLMREPVPDRVAQEFLKNFLKAFSLGKSLYLSVREARERLQGWESEFPCASWLPVIYQNPTAKPPIWQEWVRDRPQNKLGIGKVLLSSLAVTACVFGVRFMGMLQGLELQAYDRLMQLRSETGADSRLLVVTVTEQDLRLPEQKDRKGSLSDLALERLLQKLEQLKPRAIGLDIYRDFPVEPEYAALATRLQQNQRFISVCGVRDAEFDPEGVAPPPEVPTERLGFSDIAVDSDKILRRHLLIMTPNPASRCASSYAFNLQLAFRYLQAEGISPKFTSNKELQLGNTVFKRLKAHMGGYQNLDEGGYQVLLNNRSLQKIAPQVTLTQVLTGQINPNSVKDRIVLIGTTAPSFNDFLSTPYHQKVPGVLVQAQMVSQILSAVLDRQPMIWVLPVWSEVVWIWAWSLVGGLLAWRWRTLRLWIAAGAALAILFAICFGILTQGGWIPLVPSALALLATGGSAIFLGESQTKPQQKTFLFPSPEL